MSMRNAALFGLVLLVAVALLWGFRATIDPPPPDPAQNPAAVGEPTAAAAAAAAAELPQRLAPPPASPPSPAEPAAVALAIRVVDARAGTPLPGAEVVFADAATAAAVSPPPLDFEAALRAVGHRAVADDDGRLVLQVHDRLDAFGRSGELYGRCHWRQQGHPLADPRFPGELVIELRPDQPLRLRAVDPFGAPVPGLVLWLRIDSRQPDGSLSQSATNLPPTGADGITVLPHAQEQLGQPTVAGAFACAQVFGAKEVPTPFDPAAPPPHPLDVLVPAHGSIVVELRDPDGGPWDQPGAKGHGTLTALDANGHKENRADLQQPVDGVLRFQRVGLNTRFHLELGGSYRGAFGDERTIDGPTEPGQQVRIELRAAGKQRWLVGRLFGVDGTPFRRPVRARVGSGGTQWLGDVVVAGDGRFALQVQMPAKDGLDLVLRSDWGGELWETEAAWRGPLPAGRHDLGNLVLREPPLLVAGRLEGAASLWHERTWIAVEQRQPRGGRPEFWLPLEVGAAVDAEGCFAVRGHVGPGSLRVLVRGAVPVLPVEFAAGATDLRVRVDAPGRLVATFVVSEGKAGDEVPVGLVPLDFEVEVAWPAGPGGPGGPGGSGGLYGMPGRRLQDGERLTVAWEGLLPGRYRLVAGRVMKERERALDVVVVVPAGATVEDPRVLGVDLR